MGAGKVDQIREVFYFADFLGLSKKIEIFNEVFRHIGIILYLSVMKSMTMEALKTMFFIWFSTLTYQTNHKRERTRFHE